MNRIRHLLLTAAAAFALTVPTAAQDIVYTSAEAFPLYGKVADSTSVRYGRLPLVYKDVLNETLWRLGENSAGLYIRFRSDSPTIRVRWEALYGNRMAHMTDTGIKGLDLYTLYDGAWRFVHSAVPWNGNRNDYKVIGNMTPEMREYMLYLSLYDGVASLEIGIEEGYVLAPPAVARPQADRPVVMYGTSILQGGCVTRPGMVHTSIISRRLDREVINLGFSGSAHLEPQIAEWMALVPDPAVYVLDNVPNSTVEEIETRGEAFFRILRAAHPDVPVIFVEDPVFVHAYLDREMAREVAERNAAEQALFERLLAAGERRIYYVSSRDMLGHDGEATVDGIHLTDLGMIRYADLLTPVILQALAGE